MKKKFGERLDSLIKENVGIAPPPSMDDPTSQQANDLIAIATQLQETIGRLQRDLDDTQTQLNDIISQLNTNLGSEIQRRQPRLTISHKNGNCITGYRTKDLHVRPDLGQKAWMIDGPLRGQFLRNVPQDSLALSSDVKPMADAIVNFFHNQYRSL